MVELVSVLSLQSLVSFGVYRILQPVTLVVSGLLDQETVTLVVVSELNTILVGVCGSKVKTHH